jgi:carboxypeptidase Q
VGGTMNTMKKMYWPLMNADERGWKTRNITMRSLGFICLCAMLAQAEEKVDLGVLHRIKDEAFQNSRVMETEFYLTDVNGPRLANSPGYFRAADWVVKQLGDWGISAHQEKWGPFGKGWEVTHFAGGMVEPQYMPLIGYPTAWTGSTNGTVTGEAIQVDALATETDLEKVKGKLKGKVLLIGPLRDLTMHTTPRGSRLTDAQLMELEKAPDPAAGGRGGRGGNGGRGGFQDRLDAFLREEQPLVVMRSGAGFSDGGTYIAGRGGSYDAKASPAVPAVVVTPEHYNRICRLLAHQIPVKLEFNIQTRFYDDRLDSVNVVGEIPGSGPHKDQIVMIGGHLDSWHAGTGATDNAAGSAVMIEVLRILKSLNVPMDRTVRMGLWGGEEEGLLGSRAYVKEHFADPATMKPTAEHAKLAGYFNIDNGTGKVRGIYLQGNDMVRPIFEQWFAPLKDLTEGKITIRNTGGTDHQSFDGVGLPGFQFIQDPLEYETFTHHSNMDVYDRIQKGDLMQISAIVASFVYDAANREEMLPRKPLPKPNPGRRGRGGSQ